jgi:hypothetical protein
MGSHPGGHALIGAHCVAATIADALLVKDVAVAAEDLCECRRGYQEKQSYQEQSVKGTHKNPPCCFDSAS